MINCSSIFTKSRLALMAPLLLTAVIGAQLIIESAFASNVQKLKVHYGKPLVLTISSSGINRVSFDNQVIDQIVGDQVDFTAQLVGSGNELFITSKKDSGSVINCAVILASGRVIDIRFKVVNLVIPKIIQLSFESKKPDSFVESDRMIKAMVKGVVGKYYVRETNKKLEFRGFESLDAKQVKSYRYGDLYGVVVSLVNKGKSTVVIKKEKLTELFEGVVASFVEGELLEAGDSTTCYMILAEGQDV